MKRLKILIPLFIGSVLLFTYQNCGNVSLEMMTPEAVIELPSFAKPTIDICPVNGNDITTDIHYVFIIDMSLSNLGGAFQGEACGSPTSYSYNYYLNTENATDHTAAGSNSKAQRIEAIKSFVSQISTSNPNLKYSLLGFSKNAMPANSSLNCHNSTTSNLADINKWLTDLANIQSSNFRASGACSGNSPFTMSTTSYLSALNCLDANISENILLNSASKTFFQIFFITDGKPEESQTNSQDLCGSDSVCRSALQSCDNLPEQQKWACINTYIATKYNSKVQSIFNHIKSAGMGANFKPIYYGPEEEFDLARLALDQMAQMDDSNTTTSKLTSMNDLVQELANALGPQAVTSYELGYPLAVNTNIVIQGSSILLDSDGDGVADELEIQLGWDPNNARSQGIFDGLCYHLLKGTNCTPTNPARCTQDLGYGLKQCDADKLAELGAKTPLTGFDSDSDGVIDYIEIIRGTNPIQSDIGIDSDGDGLPDLQELRQGTDWQAVKSVPTIQQTKLIMTKDIASQDVCIAHGQSSHITLDNIAHSNDGNINQVLLTFIAEPMGTGKKRLYVTTLTLNSTSGFDKISLDDADVILVGEFE